MKLRHVTTKYVFDASDLPVIRDAKRRKFQPADVIVTHRSDEGFREIRVHGFTTTVNPWSTSVIWSVRDDRIQSNNVGRAPQRMHGALAQAIAMHAKPEAQADTAQATGTCSGDHRPRIVIEDDTAHVTGYTDPTDVVGALLALVESVTGVSADSYARLCDEVHRRAEQLPDDDRVPVEVCGCGWLGAGTPAHAPTGFCPEVPR